ncbi:helix-turn-helix domain-containing protein [Erwinia aphidicola]|nr:helix-turn-helix domain-containing protein [Erwinia aphidicola]
MLSVQQCEKILDIDHIHFGNVLTVDCQLNTLNVLSRKLSIPLSETQKRLLICLLTNINNKREIINIVWYENHQYIRDNNYHQLVFQLRAHLKRHQLPGDILITVPYYGLKLNKPLLMKIEAESRRNDFRENSTVKTAVKIDKLNRPSLRQWFLNAIR